MRPAEGTDLEALPYRAPEQVSGRAAGLAQRYFLVRGLLYEMVSGRRAFSGARAALDRAILEKPPATLMAKSPIHAAMEGVIAGCMEKDPARRRQRVQNAVIELKLARPVVGPRWPNSTPAGEAPAAAPEPARPEVPYPR